VKSNRIVIGVISLVLCLLLFAPVFAQSPTPSGITSHTDSLGQATSEVSTTGTTTGTPTIIGTTIPTLTSVATSTIPATPDFQATEAKIVANVLATLTAGAPTWTPTLVPTPPPTLTATPTSEWDVRCDGMPRDMICLWIHNYRGGYDTFTININNKAYQLPPGGDVVIFLPPGKYTWTANLPRQPGMHGEWDFPDANRMWRTSFR
jgi:hypothetical protein